MSVSVDPAVVIMPSVPVEVGTESVAPDATVIGDAPAVMALLKATVPSSIAISPTVMLPVTVDRPVALVPAEKWAMSLLALFQVESTPAAAGGIGVPEVCRGERPACGRAAGMRHRWRRWCPTRGRWRRLCPTNANANARERVPYACDTALR